MADWSKKTQSGDKHLANGTSARYVHIDGSVAKPFDRSTPARLLRVTIAAKGAAFTIRSGSRQVAVFTTASPEGTYHFGEYLENGLTIDGASGAGSVNVAFDV